jgi:hypothetical protein
MVKISALVQGICSKRYIDSTKLLFSSLYMLKWVLSTLNDDVLLNLFKDKRLNIKDRAGD